MTYLTEQSGKTIGMSMSGIAVHPWLFKPDTKYDANGVYNASIRVPIEEAKDMMNELAQVFKEWAGKAPVKKENNMWRFEVDDKTGEETGHVIFNLKVKNKVNKKTGDLWDRKPPVFFTNAGDATPDVGGGSQMRVEFEVYRWNAEGKKGVSLQPISVLIEKVIVRENKAVANRWGEGELAAFTEEAETNEETNANTTQEEASDFF